MGVGIAREFAREGATVMLNYPSWEAAPEEAISAVAQVGARPVAIQADVSSAAGAKALVAAAVKHCGRLDVLVNNVGQHLPADSLQQSEQEWDEQLQVNLRSAFVCSQEAARAMKGRGGAIVCIASKMGIVAAPRNAAYCCAKAGVIMLVKVLATEWAPLGIRVNAVAPGVTRTKPTLDIFERSPAVEAGCRRRTPLGRIAEPEEIGRACVFLCSDDASYVTGETLVVDGGWIANGDFIGV
jgi:NAD(P)-dependent dehydrogenase (short-subunit alcohol dehydrogenase family)